MNSRTPSYQLRAALPDDLAFQAALYASTRQEELDAAQVPAEQREPFLAQQFMAQMVHYQQFYPAGEWAIIESDGERAGRLILDRAADHYHIMDIALMPEFRGRGIGTAILREIVAEATSKQLPVRLFAYTKERALSLYHRLGFADVNDDGIHTELVWEPTLGIDV